MSKKYFLGILTLMLSLQALAGNIVLEGNYQGKNLYVRNPFAGSGVGFCVYEVTVNGNVTTDEVNSSAFEIDFSNFDLDVGDKVVVIIKHKNDCGPKVLNPEVLRPKSTFQVIDIEIDDSGVLKWNTKGETGVLDFIIEQYRWNKWIYVGEEEGKGITGKPNSYQFQITPHSGTNKFRVKQVDYTGVPQYSPEVTFESGSPAVTHNPTKFTESIVFSSETMFEVYDIHGNIVKKGFGGNIDGTNLKKGLYYLNYDNTTVEVMKKK